MVAPAEHAGIGRLADAHIGFVTDGHGQQKILAAGPQGLGHGKERRKDHHAGMPVGAAVAVIQLQGMARDAVEQGRRGAGGPQGRGQHGALRGRAGGSRLRAQHGPGQRAVDAAGQSAQIIHAAGLGRLDGCAAERVIRQGLVQAYEFV